MNYQKEIIKIKFVDFYKHFNQQSNWFFYVLSKYFLIEISDNPDFIIYSSFGNSHLNYKCTKIFYTGENERPNFFLCDYAISFDFLNRSNHIRLPLYVLWDGLDYHDLIYPAYQKVIDTFPKSKFCCFLVSNPHAKRRIEFFDRLNNYKKVDSGGKIRNNIGYQVSNKLDFISKYKFIIAFENSIYPGYVTEKIYEPFFTNTIPIYWGSDSVKSEFNPERILIRSEFSSDDAFIDRIIFLDTHPEAYDDFIRKPVFINNTPTEYFDGRRLATFFEKIFQGPKESKSKCLKKLLGILMQKYWFIKRKFIAKVLGNG